MRKKRIFLKPSAYEENSCETGCLGMYLKNGFVVSIGDSLIYGVLSNVTLSRMVTYYRVTCYRIKAYDMTGRVVSYRTNGPTGQIVERVDCKIKLPRI